MTATDAAKAHWPGREENHPSNDSLVPHEEWWRRLCQPTLAAVPPGWGGRIRTSEWRLQRPLPYRLATPQCCGCETLNDLGNWSFRAGWRWHIRSRLYPGIPCRAFPCRGAAGLMTLHLWSLLKRTPHPPSAPFDSLRSLRAGSSPRARGEGSRWLGSVSFHQQRHLCRAFALNDSQPHPLNNCRLRFIRSVAPQVYLYSSAPRRKSKVWAPSRTACSTAWATRIVPMESFSRSGS